MIEQLRRDIEGRLDQLLAEADKLRGALMALGGSNAASASADRSTRIRPRPRAATARGTRSPTRSSRAAPATSSATPAASAAPAQAQATRPRTRTAPAARSASGATKSAVLQALAGGSAMTAGEVANVTGLGRASVSTTLSKLSKSGEVTKAARGYRLSGQTEQ